MTYDRRSLLALPALALAVCCNVARPASAVPATPSPVIHAVIVVMRHGVRSPTNPNELNEYVGRTWPAWEVPPGDLTPHGAKAIELLGAAFRTYYGSDGLLPSAGCPAPESIYLYADVDQRTKATGAALLAGLAPGCGLTGHDAGTQTDPLFHPLPALGKANPDLAYASMISDTDALVPDYALAFARLDAVLGCTSGACRHIDTAGVPKTISAKTGMASVGGAVDLASTATEDLMLAYADGKAMGDFSAVPIDAQRLLELSQLHTLKYSVNETPYAARVEGSNLLARVTSSIDQAATGKAEPATRVPLSARFIAFVGHDSNLAALGGLLRVHWLMPGYQPDDTPPGSALIFEVMTSPDGGAPFVRTWYTAQTLDEMRDLSSHEPKRVPIVIPGCPSSDCPVARFDAVAAAAIDRNFVGR